MRFDWQAFCVQHNVPFVTSGPNTARGHVSVKCPWCGPADHSEHLGLSLDVVDPAWGCFRSSAHRGRNPRRLVQKLLGISFNEAQRLVDEQQLPTADAGELAAAMERLQGGPAVVSARPESAGMLLPAEFKPVLGRAYGKQFLTYLERVRGFPAEMLGEVCERYGLHYCLTGDFAWRLIFPILEEDGRLAGWTGRDIRPGAWLRYRTTEQLPNRVVFNSHHAVREERETLVIVEGPVDVIKADFFGKFFGLSAVATLGTALPGERRAALAMLAQRFKRVALLFDEGTLGEVVSLAPEIAEASGRRVELWRPGIKDPGAMSAEQLHEFLANNLQGKSP